MQKTLCFQPQHNCERNSLFSGVWGSFAGSVLWDKTGESSHLWFSLFIYSCCLLCPFNWRLCILHTNRREDLFHLLGTAECTWWVFGWSHVDFGASTEPRAEARMWCIRSGAEIEVENVWHFPRGPGLCWVQSLYLCRGKQNSCGVYFLAYVSEDSWDRSNLCLLCKWCEGQGNDKSCLLC